MITRFLNKALIILLVTMTSKAFAQSFKELQVIYSKADSSMLFEDYSENLQYCLQAMKIAEKTGDCILESESYRRLGIAYDYLKNGEESFVWTRKAYKSAIRCKSDTIAMRSARYLGALFYGIEKADSCIYYLSISAQLMSKYGYHAEAASAHGMLGEAYSTLKKDPQLAVYHYQTSMDLAKKSAVQTTIGYAFFRYGCHLARNEECLNGKPYIDSSYAIFKSLNNAEGIRWALNGIAYAESRCGSGEKVYANMSLIQEISDSLFRVETAKQSARFEALYEKEKQDNAIASLEQKTRNQRLFAISGICFLLLIAAIGWLILNRRNLRRKRLAEQEIYQLQLSNYREILETENKERKRIASELHDSLGHLLSAARMNLSMVESKDPSLQKTTEIIDEAAREVRHISHNLMPASLKELGLMAALRQMTRNLSPQGIPVIELNTGDYTSQSEDREMALYRMIQEMLANSIRHGQSTQISVILSCTNKDLILSVTDNGTGFEMYNMDAQEGLGLKNIKTRTEMMNGELDMKSTPGEGCSIRITFPL